MITKTAKYKRRRALLRLEALYVQLRNAEAGLWHDRFGDTDHDRSGSPNRRRLRAQFLELADKLGVDHSVPPYGY
jgi:hypothetical protein